MKLCLTILFAFVALDLFPQEPDTTRKTKSKQLSLSKFPKKEMPPQKNSFVIVSSEPANGPADNWESQWTNYIEKKSIEIGENILKKDGDSLKITYRVILDFSIADDGKIKDLKITCTPRHPYIEEECVKMVHLAPRKKSIVHPEKYIRMKITQPVDIKIR